MAGELDAAEVHRIVADGLAPFVGASMASASVNGHLDKLDVRGAVVSESQIETLLERLAPGLSVFIGASRSAQVIEQLRAELSAAGAKR